MERGQWGYELGPLSTLHYQSVESTAGSLPVCVCVCLNVSVCLSLCVYVYTVYGLLPHQWISALLNVTPLDGERSLALSNGMLLWQLQPLCSSPGNPFPFYLAPFYSISFLLTCVFFPSWGFTLGNNGTRKSGTITSKIRASGTREMSWSEWWLVYRRWERHSSLCSALFFTSEDNWMNKG